MLLRHRLRTEISISKSHRLSLDLSDALIVLVSYYFEAAKKQGYAVGLVSTARITHATPAAFASHIWYRDLEDYIAAQYISATETQYEAIFNSSPTASYR